MSRVSKRRMRRRNPWCYRPHNKYEIHLTTTKSMAVWCRETFREGFVRRSYTPLIHNGKKP